jgi:hypothetical protein
MALAVCIGLVWRKFNEVSRGYEDYPDRDHERLPEAVL